jgi:phosphonate degradation associated HDIG domain protein
MPLTLDAIHDLFALHGGAQYSGEPVTQLEHALQTAHLAEQSDADDELVTACLLHDLGHLLNPSGGSLDDTPTLQGIDDRHQHRVLPFLHGRFSGRVLGAVGRHVDAKRYLCRARPGYFERLSADSVRSLQLQGGIFGAAEAGAFIALPGAPDAVRLRVWDDLAKQAGLGTPPLAHFLERAARCALPAAATFPP